ncbi:MAG: cation transporter, partial [Pseudonocardiaceae bacterium]
MTTTTAPSGAPVTDIELSIRGMTCAACANRIESKLNELDGVTATVNYATEKARVNAPAGIDPTVLIAQVKDAGYTAHLPRLATAAPAETADEPDPLRPMRDRLIISVVLSVPVIAMAMIPALQFTYWQWISLALAGPVVVWAAWSFHRAAWTNLRHATATMDTLISMGVLAAFAWSLYALLFGTAGVSGMAHP